jgi:hypothetical protein
VADATTTPFIFGTRTARESSLNDRMGSPNEADATEGGHVTRRKAAREQAKRSTAGNLIALSFIDGFDPSSVGLTSEMSCAAAT